MILIVSPYLLLDEQFASFLLLAICLVIDHIGPLDV